jgi:hypothetical protein
LFAFCLSGSATEANFNEVCFSGQLNGNGLPLNEFYGLLLELLQA